MQNLESQLRKAQPGGRMVKPCVLIRWGVSIYTDSQRHMPTFLFRESSSIWNSDTLFHPLAPLQCISAQYSSGMKHCRGQHGCGNILDPDVGIFISPFGFFCTARNTDNFRLYRKRLFPYDKIIRSQDHGVVPQANGSLLKTTQNQKVDWDCKHKDLLCLEI